MRESWQECDDEPSWQPLSALPMLTTHAAEGVRLARAHLDTLREATPYRLDDASVARVIETWEVTRDDLDQLFSEAGRRTLLRPRRRGTQPRRGHPRARAQAQSVTIERLLAKSDLMKEGSKPRWGRPFGWGVHLRLTSGTWPGDRQVRAGMLHAGQLCA